MNEEKVTLFNKIGAVNISCKSPILGHLTFVIFKKYQENGNKLLIYDHRLETLTAAQTLDRVAYTPAMKKQYREALEKTVNGRLAKILVRRKESENGKREYINLFPATKSNKHRNTLDKPIIPEVLLCEKCLYNAKTEPSILWQWDSLILVKI